MLKFLNNVIFFRSLLLIIIILWTTNYQSSFIKILKILNFWHVNPRISNSRDDSWQSSSRPQISPKTQTDFVPDIQTTWRTFDSVEETNMFLDWFSKKGGKIIDRRGEREEENKSLTRSSSNTYLYALRDHSALLNWNWNSLKRDQSFFQI